MKNNTETAVETVVDAVKENTKLITPARLVVAGVVTVAVVGTVFWLKTRKKTEDVAEETPAEPKKHATK